MPTAFTAGILDGTINTFEEYAKPLARQFGALIHLRDETNNSPYRPLDVDCEYETGRLAEAYKSLEEYKTKSDKEFLDEYLATAKSELQRFEESIAKCREYEKRLRRFLAVAQDYKPPTSEHKGIKRLMIEQLETTIEHDCDVKYYLQAMERWEEELLNFDVSKLREELIQSEEKNIADLKERIQHSKERRVNANRWAEQYFQSIKLELPPI
jgi:5'-3' exonuclease